MARNGMDIAWMALRECLFSFWHMELGFRELDRERERAINDHGCLFTSVSGAWGLVLNYVAC